MRLHSWAFLATVTLATATLATVTLAACGDKDDDDTADGTADDTSGVGDDTGTDLICEAVDIPCTDDIILDLSLHDDMVSEGEVTTTTDGDDFVTLVDATAGGYNQATNNPWTYVKFSASGAQRVDIDDETALESMDWDLSLRRFIVRLNSGDSGPSCVGADVLTGQSYDDVSGVPSDASWSYEDFYDDDCKLDEDNSGLPSSPDNVVGFGEWWTYAGCVQTTLTPTLLQLADGTVIKLVIETYYLEDQDVCNETGSGGNDSGWITLRWQVLD